MLRLSIAAACDLALRAGTPHAAERVQFESARYQVGPLQQRLARERGEADRAAARRKSSPAI